MIRTCYWTGAGLIPGIAAAVPGIPWVGWNGAGAFAVATAICWMVTAWVIHWMWRSMTSRSSFAEPSSSS